MSEHNIENCISLNFFDIYNYKWGELDKHQINDIINKLKINDTDIINYINDIDIRCLYEQNKRDEIYKDIIKYNLDDEYILLNNQICRLDLNISNIDKENIINYLVILSNIIKETNKLLYILKNKK
tara:strand:+ start:576 stop:953 length:378 start_codon:yes stop_codon:yes gene_type:complete